MKDGIKEILENLKNKSFGEYELEYVDDVISRKDIKLLLDYITNLQEKANQYENPDDLTLFYMWLDVKAKDKMKELEDNLYSANQVVNELLDVKEENERLKELCDKYEEEHNTTFQEWLKELKEGEK